MLKQTYYKKKINCEKDLLQLKFSIKSFSTVKTEPETIALLNRKQPSLSRKQHALFFFPLEGKKIMRMNGWIHKTGGALSFM